MKRHLVNKSSIQPSDLPFLGAAIYSMSSWHLPFQCCVVRCLCPLWASSTCPILPSAFIMPVSPAHHSSEPLTSSNHPNQYQSGDPPLGLRNIEVPPPGKVPLCQFLLLLLSMCVGYMRTAAAMGCMDVAKASDFFCASHLGGIISMLHLSMLHPFLFLIYLGILAFILRIPRPY